MATRILKRDGREALFNIEKITNAVYKAGLAAGTMSWEEAMNLSELTAERLETSFREKAPGVEDIQDTVEQILIENGLSAAAKKYILYRAERTRIREMNTRLMRIFEEITTKDAKDNDLKRENANIDGNTSMGHMLKYGSEGAKQFNELFVLKPDHAKAHHDGDIHIHDLDFLTLTTTCCQIDIAKLFKGGFGTGHGTIREPNDIQSYSALACIAIQSNQNDQHGGQSIPNFDYGLAPGVAKTYAKLYRDNLFKALDLLTPGNSESLKEMIGEELFSKGCKPALENDDAYTQAETDLLSRKLSADQITRIQEFTRSTTLYETDKKTYQAMEALIHNLNTMHSRAGAQIPFSSINYGTDTLRAVCWFGIFSKLRKRDLVTEKLRSSRFRYLGLRKASILIPAIPTTIFFSSLVR